MRAITPAEDLRRRSCVGIKDGRCLLLLNWETFIDFRFGLWMLQQETTAFGEDSSICPNACGAHGDEMQLMNWVEVTVVPDGWLSSPEGSRFRTDRVEKALFIYVTRQEARDAIRQLDGIRKWDAGTNAGVLQLWDSVEFRLARL